MVAEHLKEKYEAQTAELYRSLGEFVVNFEHLMFGIKNKINLLCGFSWFVIAWLVSLVT